MEGDSHSVDASKRLGNASADGDSRNKLASMVIDVPASIQHSESDSRSQQSGPQSDDTVNDEVFSEISSLDFSAPDDKPPYRSTQFYTASPQSKAAGDVIEHHLNRSAMMSAQRRRAMEASSVRLSSQFSSQYAGQFRNNNASWSPNHHKRVSWGTARSRRQGLSPVLSPTRDKAVVQELDLGESAMPEHGVIENPISSPKQETYQAAPETAESTESAGSHGIPTRDEEPTSENQNLPSHSNSSSFDIWEGVRDTSIENVAGDSSYSDCRVNEDKRGAADDDVPTSPYVHQASDDSKFENYSLLVDPNQGDRAVEIELYSFARPHMRVFHLAWMSFFVAFFTWFAITPLLSEVQRSLSLSKREIWTSSTLAVAGSAVTRILIGPVNDKYGARWVMCGTLVISAIPTGLLGLIQSAAGLDILRLLIGVAGSAFVTSQYWTSSLFTWEVAGTANALVAGWGNLGGGVTQIVMGTLLFPLFKIFYGGSFGAAGQLPDDDVAQIEVDPAADKAWRTVLIVPAIMCLSMAVLVVRRSDDCPKGNYGKRRRQGLQPSVSARRAFGSGLGNLNTWVLLIQYGCSFGVEITMVNAAALYFKDEFGQSTEAAAAVASIFGWMNLFARGFGGFASDMCNAKWGMRGRLVVQTVTLVLEGVTIIGFSEMDALGGAIAVMIIFSVFVQAAEGSTFGIVPYVNPGVTGAIAGVVGAGGNVGGTGFSLLFRESDYRSAFKTMGYVALASAVLTPLIRIQGHRTLFCGEDAPEVRDRRASHAQQMGSAPSLHDGSRKGDARVTSQLRLQHSASDDSKETSSVDEMKENSDVV